jgi:hypothetical protein
MEKDGKTRIYYWHDNKAREVYPHRDRWLYYGVASKVYARADFEACCVRGVSSRSWQLQLYRAPAEGGALEKMPYTAGARNEFAGLVAAVDRIAGAAGSTILLCFPVEGPGDMVQ